MPESSSGNDASPAAHTHIRLPATCDPPGESNPAKEAVWIVFGATGHLGRSVVRAAASHGDKVTAVGWSQGDDPQELQSWQDSNSIGLMCDVRVRTSVDTIIKKAIEHWGRVDIIASCVGFGVIGACEDQDEHELRTQLDTNFFGTLNILALSLPYFRQQAHGRYLIFSSTAGALGVPGLGPYCAAKFAVEGLLESMLYEVDTFNIKATLVEPGHMRLDEPDAREMGIRKFAAFKVKQPSEPYADVHAPAGHAQRMVRWLVDRQPVSTVRSAELVWQLAHCSYPPLRLLLGNYAVESIRDRLRCIIEEIEDWKHLNFTSDEDAHHTESNKAQSEEAMATDM